MDSILQFEKAFSLTKQEDFLIAVPKLPQEFKYKAGVYQWRYRGRVVKVGIFGEGVHSSAYSRYSTYRSVGKALYSYLSTNKKQNGSVKPMKVLNEKLQQGESVEVHICKVPEELRNIDGLLYRVDLYALEEFYKNKNKQTLWLS
jgi:hypothetical protein